MTWCCLTLLETIPDHPTWEEESSEFIWGWMKPEEFVKGGQFSLYEHDYDNGEWIFRTSRIKSIRLLQETPLTLTFGFRTRNSTYRVICNKESYTS